MQCARAYWDTRERKHVLNGLKYCTSIAVVVLSLFVDKVSGVDRVWWAMSIVSTLYALGWDLVMDWGHPLCTIRGFQTLVFGESRKECTVQSESCWRQPLSRSGSRSSIGSGASSQEHPLSPSKTAIPRATSNRASDLWKGRRYPSHVYNIAAATNALARLGWAVYISPGQQVLQQHSILLLGCIELLRRAQWAAIRLEWEQLNREAKKRAAEEASAVAAETAWRSHSQVMQRQFSLF